MTNTSIDILGSFKLNHWYKLAIYFGAVLMILGFVFPNNSYAADYNSSAVQSLILGLLVWILDDALYFLGNAREAEEHYNKLRVAKNFGSAIFVVRWIGLIIWVAIIMAHFNL